MKTGECDLCNADARLGQIIVKCGRINRKLAACRDCRESFEEAIGRLVSTGEISTVHEVVKTVYEPVDRVVTKRMMPPSVWLWGDTFLGFIVGCLITGAVVLLLWKGR